MKVRRLMQIARWAKAYQGRRCASQQNCPPNDRFGQSATWQHRLATSGQGPIADIGRGRRHDRDVPIPEAAGVTRSPR